MRTVEVDTLFAEPQKHNVTITTEPQQMFRGVPQYNGHSGYFTDPDGHLWEIAHNPFLEMDGQGNVLGMRTCA